MAMKYIAIASKKGGVGKTVTAIHLAHWLSLRGEDVLLVDADANRTSTGWQARADNAGTPPSFAICTLNSMPRHLEGRTFVILDTGGDMESAELKELTEATQLVIIPTKPDIDSATAAIATADTITELGGQYRLLLTDCRSEAKGKVKQIMAELQGDGYSVLPRPIRRGAGVERASLDGSTLDKQRGTYRNPWRDYTEVFEELVTLLD